MTTTPKQLQYNSLKPAGFATKMKQIRFTPTAALNQYSYNDIIRFLINTPGFWDPYNAFIKVTVQYDDSQQPGVALQVDNSAQSLIDQLIITTNNQEIERIEQYDTISAILHDMNQTEDIKSTRLHEGINAGNRNNFNVPRFATTQSQGPVHMSNGISVIPSQTTQEWFRQLDCQASSFHPQTETGVLAQGAINLTGSLWSDPVACSNNTQIPGSVLFHPNKKRHLVPRIHRTLHLTGVPSSNSYGYSVCSNLKAKYLNKFLGLIASNEPFCDTGLVGATNGPNGQLINTAIQNEMVTQRRNFGVYSEFGLSTEAKSYQYKLGAEIGRTELGLILDNYWQDIQSSTGFAIDQSYIEQPGTFYSTSEANYLLPKYMGFQRSYCQALSTGFEAFLSSSLPQASLYNGKIQNIPTPYATKTFTFPLLSAIFGALLPRDSYRYIPMDYFQNLMFEFRMSPYAFFTSGNKQNTDPTTQFTVAEQASSRNWIITKMEILVDIYNFDEVIKAQVDSIANSTGIFLHTASWFLGPQYPLTNTASMIGTYQINMGFESLKMILMIALDSAYTTYSFCRKQFRVSHNVTQLQLRFGTEYYPPQPVQGHAGNPMGEINNSEFYQMLQKAFGKLNDIWGDMAINPINFAITERPYDPTIQTPFLSAATTTNYVSSGYNVQALNSYTLGEGSVHTQRGIPWFHENRCIGKAIYALNLEGFPSDDKLISGMDTTKIRPFEVLVNCDSANGTSRASQLIFFLYADIFYVIKPNSVQIFGK